MYRFEVGQKMTRQDTKPTPSRSQYSGTLKNTVCEFCKKTLNHLTREQQDEHASQHKDQTTL